MDIFVVRFIQWMSYHPQLSLFFCSFFLTWLFFFSVHKLNSLLCIYTFLFIFRVRNCRFTHKNRKPHTLLTYVLCHFMYEGSDTSSFELNSVFFFSFFFQFELIYSKNIFAYYQRMMTEWVTSPFNFIDDQFLSIKFSARMSFVFEWESKTGTEIEWTKHLEITVCMSIDILTLFDQQGNDWDELEASKH